ncbi:hypothetical protein [Nitrospira tepida]|uniref:hypothetical protein n=1 Tax=Nitrospira tepida TaxID=2973512 RepID=UPI00259C9AB0|nr:hypothetical protein [Nitrospira tepida]
MNIPRTFAQTHALACLLTVRMLAYDADPESCVGVNKEQAIKIANKEVDKLGLDPQDLDMEVDKGNVRWDEFMSILRDSGVAESREQYKQHQAKLQGRTFWTIFYLPKRIEGRRPKGGGATVLIDARDGEVLIVIRGE